MGEDAQPQVPNPYRAAIVSARERSEAPAQTLRTAMDKAVTAMEAGAWSGGTADTFFASLDGWRTTGRQAAAAAIQELTDAIADQPEKVDASSWQVHWHHLRP